jgi:hypothetical protein
MLRKECLGEVGLLLDDWFSGEGTLRFDPCKSGAWFSLSFSGRYLLFMHFFRYSRSQRILYQHASTHATGTNSAS